MSDGARTQRVYTSAGGRDARLHRNVEDPHKMTEAARLANEAFWEDFALKINPGLSREQAERAARILRRARMSEIRRGIPKSASKILALAAAPARTDASVLAPIEQDKTA